MAGNEEFLKNTFGKHFPTTNKMYKDLYSKQCWTWKISSREKVTRFLDYLYKDSVIHLNRKYEIYLQACAHVKPVELLESYVPDKDMPISSQAPDGEGSETIEKLVSEDQN